MQNPQDRKRNSNAYLAAVFFAPTVLIVALGIVLIVSLLKSSALRLDESQQSAERRLAQSVVTTSVTSLQKSTADYANWDDMYDQFSSRPAPQWVKENLGPYAVETFNLSHILVLAADGSISYGFMSPTAERAPDPADIDVLNEFAQSAMRSWQPGTFKAITAVGATVILLFIVLGFVWTLVVSRIRQAAVAAGRRVCSSPT